MGSQASSGSSLVALRAFLTGLPKGVRNIGVRDILGVLIPNGVLAPFGVLLGTIAPAPSSSPPPRWLSAGIAASSSGDRDREGELYWEGGQDTGGCWCCATGGLGAAGRGVIGAELISFASLLMVSFVLSPMWDSCSLISPSVSWLEHPHGDYIYSWGKLKLCE